MSDRGTFDDACNLLHDALAAIFDLDGCTGDCSDESGACTAKRIRAFLNEFDAFDDGEPS